MPKGVLIAAVAALVFLSPAIAEQTAYAQAEPSASQSLALPALGGGPAANILPVTASAVPDHTEVLPGQTFYLAVDIHVAQGWVYYSANPGKSADYAPLAAGLEVLSGAAKAGEVLWPADVSHTDSLLGVTNNVYEGRAVAYVPVAVPTDSPRGRVEIVAKVSGQACGNGACVPLYDVQAKAAVTVSDAPVINADWSADAAIGGGVKMASPVAALAPMAMLPGASILPDGVVDLTLWGGLALALLAGLTLNIMPCVLPVIPLKVLSIVQQARQSRRRFVTLGLAFAAGVVLFFVGVAAVNVVLKLATNAAFSWGQHYQSPLFIVGMSVLMVALAANLFGLFTVNVPGKLASVGASSVVPRQSHLSAVGMGLVTGVLSTPCSFAILATALGWAQAQVLWLGSLTIVMIGVGMAAPYALLTAFPKLVSRLPRPGRWMELMRQSMGFVLLLVPLWLLRSLAENAYPFWLAGFGVVLAFGLWVCVRWVGHDAPLAHKLMVRGPAAALVLVAGFWMLSPPKPGAVVFEPFDQAAMTQARESGRPVLVDFTASWCLTCQFVEDRVYNDPDVAEVLRRYNVLPLKGDVTRPDMPANALKTQLNEAIPTTVIFTPTGETIRLRGVFSKEDLRLALEQSLGAGVAKEVVAAK